MARRCGPPRRPVHAARRPVVLEPTIDALYLAEDELTTLAEISGVLRPPGSPVKLVFEPKVLITVNGSLSDILDLTDPAIHRSLGTTQMALTRTWAAQQTLYLSGAGAMPPTQVLGQEAFRTGQILGLRYPSSKNLNGAGLVVFTARLKPAADRLEVFNQPRGSLHQKLP